MVDSSGLENRYSSKQRTIEGSNPSLSFFFRRMDFFIDFGWLGFFFGLCKVVICRARKKDYINELKRKYFFNMICSTQPNIYSKIKVIPTSSIGSHVSIKGSHGKNRFKISINSFFKSCGSCASSSRVP